MDELFDEICRRTHDCVLVVARDAKKGTLKDIEVFHPDVITVATIGLLEMAKCSVLDQMSMEQFEDGDSETDE